MDVIDTSVAAAMSAQDCGRVCAVAAQGQRDLSRYAAGFVELFPDPPFDPGFFGMVPLAHAFCAPWLDAEALRLTNRMTLWVFAVDHRFDQVATSWSDMDALARRCLAVARGKDLPAGDDPLLRLLGMVRDELSAAPAFAALRDVWREEMHRMLRTMTREWQWRTGAVPLPTVDDYLDSAESGFSLVFVTHWIATTGARPVRDVPALLAASRAVELITPLLNDLGSYRRDVPSGDINALLLGADAGGLERRLTGMTARCREALRPLLDGEHRPLATYLERQVAFNNGFYRVTDYQA